MKWKSLRKGLTRKVRGRRHRLRFIPGKGGFDRLVAGLEAGKVNHLFLHWPGAGVAWPSGDQVVLLVEDESLRYVNGLMSATAQPGDLSCTLYTVGGLPGTDRNGVPYLPVRRAREMLNRPAGESFPSLASDSERLLALSAEAVYHLGLSSGLTSRAGDMEATVPSLYAQSIQQLDSRCNLWRLPCRFGLEELHSLLTTAGWAPHSDTALKLALANPWLKEQLSTSDRQAVPGLALYLIRERGLTHLDALRGILDRHGFDLLCDEPIETERRREVADQIRGGNWGRGPFPTSGGLPAHLLVVHDVYPDRSPSKASGASDAVDNARVFAAKEQMRREVNRGLSGSQRCNPVHSSDNSMQALEYLSVVAPERIPALIAESSRRNAAFVTPYPVLADLSKHARRAKIELIDFHGTRAVCKTFRPGRERFMEREILARELGKALPEVSRILEVGPSYIVFEWYDNSLEEILTPRPPFYHHGLLPLWTLDRLRFIILHYRRLGYECIDFNPHNIIYDPCRGLKIIDFEFFQPSQKARNSLKGNYAWYSVPDTYPGDIPPTTRGRPYLRRWLPYTGLPRIMCLYPLPRPILWLVRRFTVVGLSLAGARRVGRRRVRQFFNRAFTSPR